MENPNCFAPFKPACHHNTNEPRIVSLWDMLQIDTRTFLASLTHISAALGEYKLLLQVGSKVGAFSVASPVEHRAHVIKAIQNLQSNCKVHGLKTSEKMAEMAFDTCMDALARDEWSQPYNLQKVVTCLEGLLKVTVSEAESRKFYVLSGNVDEQHDDADTLFGADVIDAFPQAAFDISEAGKCQAFGLWTASVMHIMRVLEIGLQALAAHVGVAHEDNWNKTLNLIEAKLREVGKKVDGPQAEQWAAETGTQLRFIKNAWRNHAMHPLATYDEHRAKAIVENARLLLKQLASKIN